MRLKEFWGKYGQHITAISILLLLGSIWYLYYDNNQLQKQISENCGWGEDNYYCFCEKSEAMKLKNKFEEQSGKIKLNLSLLET